MTYDHELTLIHKEWIQNEIGEFIPVETEIAILCGLKSVGRTEFYSAAVAGLRPKKVFVVHSYEYSEEEEVIFNGKQYRVMRTYGEGTEEIELTCERVAADG